MSSYSTDEIWQMDGTEQVQSIKNQDISPVDALEASLQRIETLNDDLNAFCVIDEDGAMQAARDAEKAVTGDADLGALHGVPVGIKDLIPVKGLW